jgi:vacuolar-type H+-ATPase subunit E/Vma4
MPQSKPGAGALQSILEQRQRLRQQRFHAALEARRNALEARQQAIQDRVQQLQKVQKLVATLDDGDDRGGSTPAGGGTHRSTLDSEDPRAV